MTTKKLRITIDRAHLEHLDKIASGGLERMPDLADRLLDRLARATVQDSSKMPATLVSIGAQVTYRDEASGQDRTVRLVWPEEADIAAGRISVFTPVGVALLGLAEGASTELPDRSGKARRLSILKVEPAGVAAGAGDARA